MSSYNILKEVTFALRRILWETIERDEVEGDAVIHSIVGSELAIVFANPTETARDSSNRLSLWLYQVTENEFVKNQQLLRDDMVNRNNNATRRFPPLSLNLFYLVTPFAATGEADQLLLGKTMQVMYDNAIVVLRDAEAEVAEELRITLSRLSLEELTRIWEALREPYRLSVCYQVKVTRIDSTRLTGKERIIEREAGFGPEPDQKTS